MKFFKTLLLAVAIPALTVSAYAGGGCCKGDSDAKKDKKVETSVTSLGSGCGGGSCGGDSKDKDKV